MSISWFRTEHYFNSKFLTMLYSWIHEWKILQILSSRLFITSCTLKLKRRPVTSRAQHWFPLACLLLAPSILLLCMSTSLVECHKLTSISQARTVARRGGKPVAHANQAENGSLASNSGLFIYLPSIQVTIFLSINIVDMRQFMGSKRVLIWDMNR